MRSLSRQPRVLRLGPLRLKLLVEKLDLGSEAAIFMPRSERWYTAARGHGLYRWEGARYLGSRHQRLRSHLALAKGGLHVIADHRRYAIATGGLVKQRGVMRCLHRDARAGYERTWSAQTADGKLVIMAKRFRPGRGYDVRRGPGGQLIRTPHGPQRPTGRATWIDVCAVSSGKRLVRLPHEAHRMVLAEPYVAFAGGRPDRVTVYDVRQLRRKPGSARPVARLEHRLRFGASRLRFSPDRRWLAVGTAYGQLVVYDTRKWRVKTRLRLPGKRRLESLAFHPKQAWLLTGDDRAHVTLWRLKDGKRLGQIALWHRPNEPKRKFPFARQVDSLHLRADGKRLIVGMDLSGAHVRLYELSAWGR